MSENIIQSFVLVNKEEIISPVLITTRSYGSWFEKQYDNYTTQMELYMKAKTKDGNVVLEYHPGTRIGKWFDSNELSSQDLHCWYILQDSNIMHRVVKYKLAEQKDAVPTTVKDIKSRMLRVYTKQQIELYLKTMFHTDIELPIGTPKQIKITNLDLDSLIRPEFNPTGKKKLF